MNMISSGIAALLVSLQGQPAPDAAQTPAAELSATKAEAANDDDKIICRRTAILGSKFKKKICGTKKQWETLANRSSDSAREWQRRGKGLEPTDTNKPGGF